MPEIVETTVDPELQAWVNALPDFLRNVNYGRIDFEAEYDKDGNAVNVTGKIVDKGDGFFAVTPQLLSEANPAYMQLDRTHYRLCILEWQFEVIGYDSVDHAVVIRIRE